VQDALPYAVGVAISPIPIAAVLLLLTCKSALAKGFSFLGGWVVGVAVPMLLFVVLVDRAGVTDSDPVWIVVAELAIGVAFLLAAAAVWTRRQRRRERDPWADSIDSFTSVRSAGLGIALSGANPKVVALSLGAALAVADSGAATAGAVAGYTAVGAVGVLVPLALYLAAPVRAQSALRRMRAWLARHEVTVLALLGLLLGALFLRDGVAGLA
jgi:threonine/homoserine/homoserine lactone efflux protein